MSESLKYFESKSETDIINWMMSNLTEQQIKMCIENKGSPPSGAGPSGGVAPSVASEVAEAVEEAESAEAIRQVSSAIEEEAELEGMPPLEDDGGAGPGVDLFAGFELSALNEPALQPLVLPAVLPPAGDSKEAEELAAALAVTQLESPPAPIVLFNPNEAKVFDTIIGHQQKMAAVVSEKPILSQYFKMPPLFIYDVSDKDGQTTVNYYRLNVDTPGNITFVPDSIIWGGAGGVSAPGLKARWKRQLTELENGLATWNAGLLSRIPGQVELEVKSKPEFLVIREKYGPGSLARISQESIRSDDLSYFGKLSHQPPAFLQKYGTHKFGAEFMSTYRPRVSTNKFGTKTLQWVRS